MRLHCILSGVDVRRTLTSVSLTVVMRGCVGACRLLHDKAAARLPPRPWSLASNIERSVCLLAAGCSTNSSAVATQL